MRMGQDGFALLKPEENGGEVGTGGGGGGGGGGLFGNLFGNRPFGSGNRPSTESTVPTEPPQIDTDVFDPITEIKLHP